MIITGTFFMNQTIIFSETKRFLVLQVFACDADLSDFCLVHHCSFISRKHVYKENIPHERLQKMMLQDVRLRRFLGKRRIPIY